MWLICFLKIIVTYHLIWRINQYSLRQHFSCILRERSPARVTEILVAEKAAIRWNYATNVCARKKPAFFKDTQYLPCRTYERWRDSLHKPRYVHCRRKAVITISNERFAWWHLYRNRLQRFPWISHSRYLPCIVCAFENRPSSGYTLNCVFESLYTII